MSDPGPTSASARKRPRLLVHYALILAALLVPMLGVLAIVGKELGDAYRRSVDRRLESTAQSLAVAVERTVLRHVGALETLANSPSFGIGEGPGNVPLLYEHAKQISGNLGTNIVVIRPDMSQLFNTLAPLDAELPKTGGQEVARRTFESGKSQVSNLVYGRVAKRYAVGAIVPVRDRNDRVRLAIAAAFNPKLMADALSAGLRDLEGFATLVDEKGKVIARSDSHDKFVGSDVPAWWAKATVGRERGMVIGPNLLGKDVLVYHVPVPSVPNWTLATALPVSVYEEYWRQPLIFLFSGLIAALVLSAGLAYVLARRIERPLRAISETARSRARTVESGKPLPSGGWPDETLPAREVGDLRDSFMFFEAEVVRRDALQRETLHRLETALADRELLLGEVYHRVKNNLQQIAAMIAMQSRNLEDADAKAALATITDRVRALGLIHEMLLRSAHPSRLDVRPFLEELRDNIARSHDLESRNLTIDVESGNEQINLDTAIPIGLLVSELVANALKHAFEGRDRGTIRIRYAPADESRVRLSVSDDGTGMKDPPTPGAAGSGTRIAEGLARQLGGILDVSTGHNGTTVTVEFPSPGADEDQDG